MKKKRYFASRFCRRRHESRVKLLFFSNIKFTRTRLPRSLTKNLVFYLSNITQVPFWVDDLIGKAVNFQQFNTTFLQLFRHLTSSSSMVVDVRSIHDTSITSYFNWWSLSKSIKRHVFSISVFSNVSLICF